MDDVIQYLDILSAILHMKFSMLQLVAAKQTHFNRDAFFCNKVYSILQIVFCP